MMMDSNRGLPWSSVWITGAGKGIGNALAKRFCQQGLTVYCSSRTHSDLRSLMDQCHNYSGHIIAMPLDITDRQSILDLVESWASNKMMPDLVILNAGTHDPFSAKNFCSERCNLILQTNLQGTINCIDPILKRFIAQNSGHIAVVSSVAGYIGLPTAAAYGASKAALINLCEALKLDLHQSDVKIQVINPGFVRTPLTDKNDFHMPALLEPEIAADTIIRGLLSDRFEIAFPRRLVYVLKFLRVLPYSWYFKLMNYMVKTSDK